MDEQVKELRERADIYEKSGCAVDGIVRIFRQAADTIEALSTKLAADMERSEAHYGGGWIPAKIKNSNFICDDRLKDYYGTILITYETAKKKRYTSCVLCNYGHISKRSKGEVIAWQFKPEPYREP